MDATSLSFRRALDSWSAIFSTDNEMPKKKLQERKISKVHLIVSLILHFHHNIICHYTRFSDQVFIAHPETRKLLLRYSLKGIQNDMHSHLLELTDKHAKCIAPLLKHLTSTRNDTDIVTSWCPCMAEGTYTDRMNGVHAWLRAPILV